MKPQEAEPDLYAVLGLQPSAAAGEITSAFRARVRELRPDTRVDAATAARFGVVRAAYETLRDPALRAAYDRRYERTPGPASDPEATPAPPARRYVAALGDVLGEPPLRAGPVRWTPAGERRTR